MLVRAHIDRSDPEGCPVVPLPADALAALAAVAPATYAVGDVWFMPRELVPMGASDKAEHPAVVARVRRSITGAPVSLMFIAGTSGRVSAAKRLLVPAGEAGLPLRTCFHFGFRHREVSVAAMATLRGGAYLGRLGVERLAELEQIIASAPQNAVLARMGS